MNHAEVVLLIVLWCWSSFALGAPQVPEIHKEAIYLREVERLSCDKEGRIQRRLPTLETPSESGQAESLPILQKRSPLLNEQKSERTALL